MTNEIWTCTDFAGNEWFFAGNEMEEKAGGWNTEENNIKEVNWPNEESKENNCNKIVQKQIKRLKINMKKTKINK